jgi:hypothetical protein
MGRASLAMRSKAVSMKNKLKLRELKQKRTKFCFYTSSRVNFEWWRIDFYWYLFNCAGFFIIVPYLSIIVPEFLFIVPLSRLFATYNYCKNKRTPAITQHSFTIARSSSARNFHHMNNKKDLLDTRRSIVCIIGAGDGNRTHDISLEG